MKRHLSMVHGILVADLNAALQLDVREYEFPTLPKDKQYAWYMTNGRPDGSRFLSGRSIWNPMDTAPLIDRAYAPSQNGGKRH